MTVSITNAVMRTMGVRTDTDSSSGVTSMTKKISLISIPIIAMVVLTNIPTASAVREARIEAAPPGVVEANQFVACMDACDRIEHDFIKLICYTACLVLNIIK